MDYIFHIFCKLAQTGINWLRMGLDGQRKKRYERIFSYRSIMRLVFNDDDAAVWLVAFASYLLVIIYYIEW